jgi:multiple sugar transport system permease protein
VIGAVAVPGTALAVPTVPHVQQDGHHQHPWSVIIPSLISPFGLYLMWTFSAQAIPDEMLEAARIDGAGEFRTFSGISCRCWAPASSRSCCSAWCAPGTTTSCR